MVTMHLWENSPANKGSPMPYSVRVNELNRTITLVCWGDVSVDEMMEYERRYWGGPEHEGFHHIIDLQVARLDFDLNDGLMLVTHATPTNPHAYRGARSAIVVGDEDTEILCIMYRDARHTMCKPEIREIAIFHDIEEAKAWALSSEVTYGANP